MELTIWLIQLKITSRSNVSIRGNGNATILKRMYDQISTANYGVITLTTATYCAIRDLQIDGNKAVYTKYYNSDIYLTSSSSNNNIIGNICNNSYYGINIYTSSSNNNITGNICNNNRVVSS